MNFIFPISSVHTFVRHIYSYAKFGILTFNFKPWMLNFNFCQGITLLLNVSISFFMKIDRFVIKFTKNQGC